MKDLRLTNELMLKADGFYFNGKKISETEMKKVKLVHFDGSETEVHLHYSESIEELKDMFDIEDIMFISFNSKYPLLQKRGMIIQEYLIGYPDGKTIKGFNWRNPDDGNLFLTFYPSIERSKKLGNSYIKCNTECTTCDEKMKCEIRFFVEKGMNPYGFIMIPLCKNTEYIEVAA